MTHCKRCNDTGEVDSGGFSPQGHPISVGCPDCYDLAETTRRWRVARVRSLQQTRDYAAPELVPQITAKIDRLLAILEQEVKL